MCHSQDFFKKPPKLCADNPFDAMLMNQAVSLAQSLLDFGFYHDDAPAEVPTIKQPRSGTLTRLSELLDPLLDLFDARDENPKRTEHSAATEEVLQCRLGIAKFLETVFDCRQEVRLFLVFSQFEKLFESKFSFEKECNPLAQNAAANVLSSKADSGQGAGVGVTIKLGDSSQGMLLQQFSENPER